MDTKLKLPFSKGVVLAARYESYIVAILLFLFVWFDKDVSSISILATLAWGGYRLVQSAYIWMAKNEHLMELKLKYKELGLNSDDIPEQADENDSEVMV